MPITRSSFCRITLTLLITLVLAAGVVRGEPADWEIDPDHFSIAFAADHVGYQQQLGLFLEASGNFRYDSETQELSAGRVEVQADSVFTNHRARDNHLTGRDFLNARRSPVIVFEATSFVSRSDATGLLTGNLTLLDATLPVELEVTINKQATYPFGHRKETLGISAHTTINRSRWGMDYGVADNLVGDEITLRFEFEAIKQ